MNEEKLSTAFGYFGKALVLMATIFFLFFFICFACSNEDLKYINPIFVVIVAVPPLWAIVKTIKLYRQ